MILAALQDAQMDAVLRMNERFVHWLSPLDRDRLAFLMDLSPHARCALDPDSGACLGALIAYPDSIDYPDHRNMAWLRRHLPNFVYVDRVVIAEAAQGRGIAQALYADVDAFARSSRHSRVACEVNTRPDNPGSHRFHQKQGFAPLGEQDFGDYAVRYYAKTLAS